MATAACAPPLGATERVPLPRKGKENHFSPCPNRGRVEVNKSARLGAEGKESDPRNSWELRKGVSFRRRFRRRRAPKVRVQSSLCCCSFLSVFSGGPDAVGAGTGDLRWPAGQLAPPAGRERVGRKNLGTGPSLLYFPRFQLLGEIPRGRGAAARG